MISIKGHLLLNGGCEKELFNLHPLINLFFCAVISQYKQIRIIRKLTTSMGNRLNKIVNFNMAINIVF